MTMLVWCTILDDGQHQIWQSKGVVRAGTSVPIVCSAGTPMTMLVWYAVLDAKLGIDRYGMNEASKCHGHADRYLLLLLFLQSPQPAVP